MARTVAGAAPSRLNRKFLVVAVLLAALSATLIYAGLSSSRGGSKSSSGGAAVSVVVAKSAIKQRTTVTRDWPYTVVIEVDNSSGKLLPYLTARITNTHSFAHVFDFHGRPRSPDPAPLLTSCKGTDAFHFYREEQDWPPDLRDMTGWWS